MTKTEQKELATARQYAATWPQYAARTTPITARTVAAFDRAGVPILKTGNDGHLYMAQGKRYVDCHYANIVLR